MTSIAAAVKYWLFKDDEMISFIIRDEDTLVPENDDISNRKEVRINNKLRKIDCP